MVPGFRAAVRKLETCASHAWGWVVRAAVCPACGTIHTRTVAGEAAWNQRAATGSSGTAPPGDDQHRPGASGADGITQGHRAGSAAEQGGRGVHDPFLAAGQGAVDPVREPAVVGELQAGHALGDHGPDPRVGAKGRDGLLTAHQQRPWHGCAATCRPPAMRTSRPGSSP